MTTAEDLRIVIFLAFIVTIHALALGIVFRWLLQKLNLITLPKTSARTWPRRIVLSLSAIGIVCVAYGYYIEPYWLDVSHIKITSPKLPAGSAGSQPAPQAAFDFVAADF
jgi:flagellar basal body-associated protein FliL